MRPKWAQPNAWPIGLDRVAQHHCVINPDTPGFSPETLGRRSDIRSSTRILRVLARRLWVDVRTSDPPPGYFGFWPRYSGFLPEEVLTVCFHKLVLSCSLNPAHVNALPFLSSPSHLSKTRVRVFPFSKYNGQEFKNEFT